MRIYLGKFIEQNLPSIQELEQRFGPVDRIDTHQTFLHFDALSIKTPDEFCKIHSKLNGTTWKGSKITIQLAKTPSPHSRFSLHIPETDLEISKSLAQKSGKKQRRLLVQQSSQLGRGWVRGKLGHLVISPLRLRTPHAEAKGGRIRSINVFNNLKTSLSAVFSEPNREKSIQVIWKKYSLKTETPNPSQPIAVSVELVPQRQEEKVHIQVSKRKDIIGNWSQVVQIDQPISFSLFPQSAEINVSQASLGIPSKLPKQRPPLLGLVKTRLTISAKIHVSLIVFFSRVQKCEAPPGKNANKNCFNLCYKIIMFYSSTHVIIEGINFG